MERSPGSIRITPEVRAYIEKIDRFRAGRDPVRLMRAHPNRIERAVRGLTPAQLRKRPAPGTWSIGEILGHLLDTEIVYGYRYRLQLGEPGSPIPAYDQDRWTDTQRGRRTRVSRLLRQIRVLREVNLDLVTSVPRTWWKRYGVHSERGKESLRRTLELIAGHDLNHLDQILAIRKRFGWTAGKGRARRPPARRRAAA